jgi:hypothetical protein
VPKKEIKALSLMGEEEVENDTDALDAFSSTSREQSNTTGAL